MEDGTSPRAAAVAALAEMFAGIACRSADLAHLEPEAIALGCGIMAQALGLALEAYDARLLEERPPSLRAHDVWPRTLATEVGDVAFSMRRCRDGAGCDVYLLADAPGIPYGRRRVPGAGRLLRQGGAAARPRASWGA